ncbi:MAG: diguanylate cyclase [Longimicrobiaceae bacterium]
MPKGRKDTRRKGGGDAVAEAFGRVAPAASPAAVAEACAAAVRELIGVPCRIEVPRLPLPIAAGADHDGLELFLEFAAFGGSGRLLAAPGAERARGLAEPLVRQLERVWEVQSALKEREEEVDRLRFQLAALEQVARTFTKVRGVEETKAVVLDSAREIFFAWWAALFREVDDRFAPRAVRAVDAPFKIGEISKPDLPPLSFAEPAPVVPAPDAAIHGYVEGGVGVIAPLPFDEGADGLLLLGGRMTEAPYEPHDLKLLQALADSSATALQNAYFLERLRTQATLDPLTGCLNRRGFDEQLAVELKRSGRYRRPVSFALLDIDNFKQINDAYGHEAGDEALRWFGGIVRRAVRETDVVGRYGGEEFAIILPETSKEAALQLAERLREQIEDTRHPALSLGFTASFGVATHPDDADDKPTLVRVSDRALYRAKTEGRNRVSAA